MGATAVSTGENSTASTGRTVLGARARRAGAARGPKGTAPVAWPQECDLPHLRHQGSPTRSSHSIPSVCENGGFPQPGQPCAAREGGPLRLPAALSPCPWLPRPLQTSPECPASRCLPQSDLLRPFELSSRKTIAKPHCFQNKAFVQGKIPQAVCISKQTVNPRAAAPAQQSRNTLLPGT